MKISVFNGSPRGEKSNSTVINKWLIGGIADENNQYIIKDLKKHDEYIDIIESSEKVIMTFPLYSDGMPGVVMKFFELIYANKERLAGTEYLFVIHSGFPEAKHCYGLRDYLINFTEKVDGKLYDVIIYGGSEGTRLAPEKSQKKKSAAFNSIGLAYAKGQAIAPADRDRLMKPIQLGKPTQFAFKLLSKTSLLNMYWDSSLKKNNALDKSFDKPYLNKSE